jgi:hypothetical protein
MSLKSKKQRRQGVEMRRLNLYLPDEVVGKIRDMAGPLADNAFVEELAKREWQRRERRMLSVQITEKAC